MGSRRILAIFTYNYITYGQFVGACGSLELPSLEKKEIRTLSTAADFTV